MTKEEAIKTLRANVMVACDTSDKVGYGTPLNKAIEQALDMAIKALEQQPSDDEITITMKKGTLKCSGHGYVTYNKDWFRKHFATEVQIMTGYDGYIEQPTSDDCVSRRAMLEYQQYLHGKMSNEENHKFWEFIKDLPPVTPTQRWVPVNERLPKPNTAVLTYISTGPSETFCLAYWNDIQNYWEDWIGYKSIEKDRGYKVLAWQPLPKPYEEKRGDSDGSN
jgi:hypothetical protein